MSARRRLRSERDQLELFRALPGDLAPRDAQDLMTYPFFSLAKTHRITPIDFRMNDIAIRVEAVAEHGMATIWDADVLIWAASQIVEARDAGLRTSRLMVTTPREILTFTGRGTGARDYHRLKAALDRLQSTTVATSLRQTTERRMHRFSSINEWTERADAHGRADGIDLIVPDWFDLSPAAFIANGDLNLNTRMTDSVGANYPKLFAVDLALANTASPVTNVLLTFKNGPSNSHSAVFALSGLPAQGSGVRPILSISRLPGGTLRISSSQPALLQSTAALNGTNTIWQNEGFISSTIDVSPAPGLSAKFYRVIGQ